MKRMHVNMEEIGRVRSLLMEKRLSLGVPHFTPFSEILPLLRKPDSNRLVWSRTFRKWFAQSGLKCSVRNPRQGYLFQVMDAEKWAEACKGIDSPQRPEAPIVHSKVPDPPRKVDMEDHLIPNSDPMFLLPSWTGDLLKAIEANERSLLVGPTGCGKSSLVKELAARKQARFMRVNLSGESSVPDLIGQWKVQGKEMIYQEGPVPTAMKQGCWLVLDELDAAIPQVLFCIQALAEEGGRLLIPELQEWIEPHPDFRLIATANTLGKGDESGLYAGTNVLNETFLDRFHSVFTVDYLPAAEEKRMLLQKVKGLKATDAERMIKVANDIRGAVKSGVLYCTFSTRRLIAWANKTIQLGNAKQASIYTVLNRLSDDDRKPVSEVLQRHGF